MTTRRWGTVLLITVLLVAVATTANARTKHRLGVGAHYWLSADDIELDNVDTDGFAWLVTYQVRPIPLVKFEAALEMLPDNFYGSSEQVFAPQAYAIAGGWLYAGIGIGVFFSDGEFIEDPFYALRAGIDVPVLPHIHVDINANYRFMDWDNINNLDQHVSVDTITVGAAVRIQI
ncbi:MAG: hypothetical protein QGH42_04045 [Kiritimatiellia bacterium]|jgi:hypothetical protein|nr:hypothetical protein [Kiritimatiellia bacterium]MDP6630867.1 hypothetical protein [Kiritimatiellia bacterium]MDP6811135.1 hypothetical protein [Kiritimatiellia bacterium]MDP7023408.1 hypothetical protein [Kiritimatiellia bacterium]